MTRALPTHVLSSLFVLCMLTFAPATAQIAFEENRTAKQILDSYESFERAVLEMTRDEWAVVRAWEGFDEERYLTFLHEYHDSFDGSAPRRRSCGCRKSWKTTRVVAGLSQTTLTPRWCLLQDWRFGTQ